MDALYMAAGFAAGTIFGAVTVGLVVVWSVRGLLDSWQETVEVKLREERENA